MTVRFPAEGRFPSPDRRTSCFLSEMLVSEMFVSLLGMIANPALPGKGECATGIGQFVVGLGSVLLLRVL